MLESGVPSNILTSLPESRPHSTAQCLELDERPQEHPLDCVQRLTHRDDDETDDHHHHHQRDSLDKTACLLFFHRNLAPWPRDFLKPATHGCADVLFKVVRPDSQGSVPGHG